MIDQNFPCTTRARCTGRIKPGTHVWQDFRSTVWPYTVGEHFGGGKANPDQRFVFERCGRQVIARAPGFGALGGDGYGNGALFISAAPPTALPGQGESR